MEETTLEGAEAPQPIGESAPPEEYYGPLSYDYEEVYGPYTPYVPYGHYDPYDYQSLTEEPEAVSVSLDFKDGEIFGIGFDVILVALAYILSIGFVVSAMRDISDFFVGVHSRAARIFHKVSHAKNILPIVIGAATGPIAWDLIVRLAGYTHVEFFAGVFLGICSGAFSPAVADFLHALLKKYKQKMGLEDKRGVSDISDEDIRWDGSLRNKAVKSKEKTEEHEG